MKPPLSECSRYFLIGVGSDLVREYLLRCIFCGHEDTIGLPGTVSVGFHFSFPLRCCNCGKSSVHYRGNKAQKGQGPSEGTA